MATIKVWPRPVDKPGVKSVLQTVHFCQVFIRVGGDRTYSDVTLPLQKLTANNVRFKWTNLCEDSFQELKELLSSDTVMANYDPSRATRLYVDDGPTGVGQEYEVEDLDHPAWQPVTHNSRAQIESELNYG